MTQAPTSHQRCLGKSCTLDWPEYSTEIIRLHSKITYYLQICISLLTSKVSNQCRLFSFAYTYSNWYHDCYTYNYSCKRNYNIGYLPLTMYVGSLSTVVTFLNQFFSYNKYLEPKNRNYRLHIEVFNFLTHTRRTLTSAM